MHFQNNALGLSRSICKALGVIYSTSYTLIQIKFNLTLLFNNENLTKYKNVDISPNDDIILLVSYT